MEEVASSPFASPTVSVIVPHYNDFDHLAACIESLRRQSYPRGCYEIIVADNNSKGGVEAVAGRVPDVKVVAAPEQGAGPARNAGVLSARGMLLAFIDSDCIAHKDWLSEGLAALDRFDYAGGQVITTTTENKCPTPAEAFEAVFAFNFKKYIENDHFTGAGNLFVPKAVFERVGGFRARVSEDVEWCQRANALGLRLGYADRAIVYHPARRNWSELIRRWERTMTEDIYLAMEQPGWRLRWLAYAAIVTASPLGHWTLVLRSKRLAGWRAKTRGLSALLRIRIYRGYRMIGLLLQPPQ